MWVYFWEIVMIKSGGAFLILETASCLTRLINLCFYISHCRMKIEKSSKPGRALCTFIFSAERPVKGLWLTWKEMSQHASAVYKIF